MENTCPEIEVAPQSKFSCPTKNADGEKKKISLAEVPKGQTTFDVVKEKFSFGLYKKAAQSQIGDSEQVCCSAISKLCFKTSTSLFENSFISF